MRQLLRVFPVAVAIALDRPGHGADGACRPRRSTGSARRSKTSSTNSSASRSSRTSSPRTTSRRSTPRRSSTPRSSRPRPGSPPRKPNSPSSAATSARWRCGRSSAAAPPRSARCSRTPTNLNDVLQRDELARVALSAGDVTTDELDALVVRPRRRPCRPRRQARAGRRARREPRRRAGAHRAS